ncbi:paraquat-inducible protein A [Halomonas cupida]|uniref:Paraquat-inducible protein A n=2 Tax=Halomonas cupida TaxID=44933 RepID=A0A1M7AUK6_9GAMM|nr:paraquat-inducible protein A [Halomonas cupida]SHL46347.1 paraquat-inducible protein A [Halomonas cupida]
MPSKVSGRLDRLRKPQITHHPAPETQLTTRRRLRACHECDWVMALPPLKPREQADCVRCGHPLVKRHSYPAQRSMSLALGALIALLLALLFPFISFSTRGIGNEIEVTQSATELVVYGQPVVALVVMLAVFVLPALYLVAVVWLQCSLMLPRRLPWSHGIARSLSHIAPWLMADVFIVGTMVSLIKIAGLADITIGIGFWAFIAYALLLLATTLSLDTDWLWFSLSGEPLAPEGTRTGETAAPQNLTGCSVCGLIGRLNANGKGICERCGERLHTRRPASVQRCWALLATAAVLYIPANIYPIMYTTTLGSESPNTIIGGVIYLASHGSWPVAIIIFVASVIVPIGKILALVWLCLVAPRAADMRALTRTRLYRLTELIGRWSMVDVFVVAILSALIHAGALMSVTPGAAALPFAGVVVVTMLAAMSFDPRILWDGSESRSPQRDDTVAPVDEQGSTP